AKTTSPRCVNNAVPSCSSSPRLWDTASWDGSPARSGIGLCSVSTATNSKGEHFDLARCCGAMNPFLNQCKRWMALRRLAGLLRTGGGGQAPQETQVDPTRPAPAPPFTLPPRLVTRFRRIIPGSRPWWHAAALTALSRAPSLLLAFGAGYVVAARRGSSSRAQDDDAAAAAPGTAAAEAAKGRSRARRGLPLWPRRRVVGEILSRGLEEAQPANVRMLRVPWLEVLVEAADPATTWPGNRDGEPVPPGR
ncbi:hypothetical protein TSOC_011366, partial [Tetrabaena socialis]